MSRLQGKIIAITGASSGIGRATAILAAKQGATPILLARSSQALAPLTEELRTIAPEASFYLLDVTNERQIKETIAAIIERYGQIDIWVNNAGYGLFESFVETDVEEYLRMMDVNYLGTVRCTKSILPYMLKHQEGHIINVASLAGKLATPKSSAYAASKFAVLGLTSSLQQELKGSGVYVSAINPGPVRTPFLDRADKQGTYRKKVERYLLSPEEVARHILRVYSTKKTEVTLPRYMQLGVVIYHLFPWFYQRVIAPLTNKK